MFSVAPASWTNPPAPASAVPTVRVLLFVYEPVTVTREISRMTLMFLFVPARV